MDRFKSISQTSLSVVITDSVATVVVGGVDSDRPMTARVQNKHVIVDTSLHALPSSDILYCSPDPPQSP